MRINHHVSVIAPRRAFRPLAAAGVPVHGESSGRDEIYLIFDIHEDDPRWPAVASWIADVGADDWVSATFSDEEVVAARLSAVRPNWFDCEPYPTPGTSGYLDVTFDRTAYCEMCGIGARQKAPFRFRREPRWGRHAVMGLYAGFGEVFVRADVYAEVFAPHGVAARPVVRSGDRVLETVVQLDVNEVVEFKTRGLEVADGLTRCPACHQRKYDWVQRGPLPPLRRAPQGPIAWAEPWFGSGLKAERYLLLSQPVARAIVAAKLRGAVLHPVAEPARRARRR
jgi:hypothetical protein